MNQKRWWDGKNSLEFECRSGKLPWMKLASIKLARRIRKPKNAGGEEEAKKKTTSVFCSFWQFGSP